MAAKLISRSGPTSGSEKEINNDLLRIGRDPANDFVVDAIEVSRNHAKITYDQKAYSIDDLNSTNGTFVNGKRISKPEKLKDGDLISLGASTVMEFSLGTENLKEAMQPKVERTEVKKERNPLFSKKKEEPVQSFPEEANTSEKSKKNFPTAISKLPTWAVVLLIALGFIVLFCIIPAILIEITNQWCNLFSGFFNAMSAGICP
jgi:pSer/pThr/pTyr-binding forkhead associated (FHA) protein